MPAATAEILMAKPVAETLVAEIAMAEAVTEAADETERNVAVIRGAVIRGAVIRGAVDIGRAIEIAGGHAAAGPGIGIAWRARIVGLRRYRLRPRSEEKTGAAKKRDRRTEKSGAIHRCLLEHRSIVQVSIIDTWGAMNPAARRVFATLLRLFEAGQNHSVR
jgi:hypothetical protein